MAEKPLSVIVADAECPACGATRGVVLKANKKGHLYIYCPPVDDGGCHNSSMSRSNAADLHYARRFAKKWRKPEYRKAYLIDAPAPAADPEPAPAADPEPAPEPAPADPEAAARKALFG